MPGWIEIVVSPTGETTVQTKGFTGDECLRASRFLEESLGAVTSDRKTADYYQQQTVQQEARQ